MKKDHKSLVRAAFTTMVDVHDLLKRYHERVEAITQMALATFTEADAESDPRVASKRAEAQQTMSILSGAIEVASAIKKELAFSKILVPKADTVKPSTLRKIDKASKLLTKGINAASKENIINKKIISAIDLLKAVSAELPESGADE